MKNLVNNLKSNPIGAVVGAGTLFWASKKYMGVSNTWARVGVALVGAFAGAYAQKTVSAKMSQPKGK